MSHMTANLTKPADASSGGGRVAMRDRVRIEQRWRRKARRKKDRVVITIKQIHRGDRSVDAMLDGRLIRVPFHALSSKYVLIDNSDNVDRRHSID